MKLKINLQFDYVNNYVNQDEFPVVYLIETPQLYDHCYMYLRVT